MKEIASENERVTRSELKEIKRCRDHRNAKNIQLHESIL